MSRGERIHRPASAGQEPPVGSPQQEWNELSRRREKVERDAALRQVERAALEQEEATARERLRQLDERIESLLSADPQDFVIRFLQTGGE